MCNYIKDDGEQCGMDDEPFCHHHEDSAQAAQYAAGGGSSGVEMERTCDDCEASLRRTERLSEHPNMNGRLVFEAVVECDCDEHVLGTKSVRTGSLPEGWQ
jgi:hypothetical protein